MVALPEGQPLEERPTCGAGEGGESVFSAAASTVIFITERLWICQVFLFRHPERLLTTVAGLPGNTQENPLLALQASSKERAAPRDGAGKLNCTGGQVSPGPFRSSTHFLCGSNETFMCGL